MADENGRQDIEGPAGQEPEADHTPDWLADFNSLEDLVHDPGVTVDDEGRAVLNFVATSIGWECGELTVEDDDGQAKILRGVNLTFDYIVPGDPRNSDEKAVRIFLDPVEGFRSLFIVMNQMGQHILMHKMRKDEGY